MFIVLGHAQLEEWQLARGSVEMICVGKCIRVWKSLLAELHTSESAAGKCCSHWDIYYLHIIINNMKQCWSAPRQIMYYTSFQMYSIRDSASHTGLHVHFLQV